MKKKLFKILSTSLFIFFFYTTSATQVLALSCGETGFSANDSCTCADGSYTSYTNDIGAHAYCCGWVSGTSCSGTAPGEPLDPFGGVGSDTLDTLNPLLLGGSESNDVTVFEESEFASDLSNPGGIINRALDFAFPLAGLILFLMIVFGGFQMLTSSAGKKDIESGKKRVTAAIVGFIILFAAYWIVQIIEQVLGVNIFNS